MQRGIAAVLLLFAASVFASENPLITPSIVTLKPGETKTLALSTWWSGLTPLPQHNVFVSDSPDVAQASGSLTWVGSFGTAPVLEPIEVKALAPGVAHVIDLGSQRPYATIAVTCDPPGSGIAFPIQQQVIATPLQHVTLEIGTAGFDNPSYAWYYGTIGDLRSPSPNHASSSEQIAFAPGPINVWAEVWDRCNYAAIEFTIYAGAPPLSRRRAARH
ncbi:MAG TPA: hypothetical protein VGR95_20140 [Thermoanaerobaculia bacterium]|nr:hypothetical protein [Thermoanaerobaculia bacterium]